MSGRDVRKWNDVTFYGHYTFIAHDPDRLTKRWQAPAYRELADDDLLKNSPHAHVKLPSEKDATHGYTVDDFSPVEHYLQMEIPQSVLIEAAVNSEVDAYLDNFEEFW